MTTTYENLEPGQAEYEYSRPKNPTRTELEKYLASLESAKYALSFSSGLGALTTTSFLLKSGQHLLCCDDVYGGTHRFFTKCIGRMGIDVSFVRNLDVEGWLEHFRPGVTKLVWIETPTNPTMKITDYQNLSLAVKKLDPECLIVVDNTFMSPVLQNPLKLGADIVMHSCTKYINGHSDVIMGALMLNNDDLYAKLTFFQNALGIVPSAFDCSQVIRSIKTLDLRVKRQAESAMKIAKFLEGHDGVSQVMYPGLESHPQHELAVKQYPSGLYGGMISFYVKSDDGSKALKLVQSTKVFHLAVSLGCVSSLIEIPSIMTHSAVPEDERNRLGMTDNLVRLSIGIEDVDDLIHDLLQAFQIAFSQA